MTQTPLKTDNRSTGKEIKKKLSSAF